MISAVGRRRFRLSGSRSLHRDIDARVARRLQQCSSAPLSSSSSPLRLRVVKTINTSSSRSSSLPPHRMSSGFLSRFAFAPSRVLMRTRDSVRCVGSKLRRFSVQAGRAAAGPSRSTMAQLAQLGAKYPFAFGVLVATLKTPAADYLVQKYVEKRKEIDFLRLGVFTLFGFAYLGVFQYWVYVTLFSRFFRNTASFAAMPFRQKITNIPGLIDLGKQIVVDLFIHAPFCFFPCYYVMKESIQGKQNITNGGSMTAILEGAATKFRTNIGEDLINLWKIWIPGDAFVFALPLYLRLPANHAISFVYVCILSITRGAADDHVEQDVPVERTQAQARD